MTITERLNKVGKLVKSGDYKTADKQIDTLWNDYNNGVFFDEDDEVYLTILTDEICAYLYENKGV